MEADTRRDPRETRRSLIHFLLFYIFLNKSATRNVNAIKVISAVVCREMIFMLIDWCFVRVRTR